MDTKIYAHSVSVGGKVLVTGSSKMWRPILPEFNTHRDFSRNSASSRAIPVEKTLARVLDDPAGPIFWGANQSGMKARTEVNPEDRNAAEKEWLLARDSAVEHARRLNALGLHKQIVNRLLEPFTWQTVLWSFTEGANFFALRCHPDAQPEIRVVAEDMRRAIDASEPTLLQDGEWHLPLVREEDRELAKTHPDPQLLLKLSAARCARVSYLTHDGLRDVEADIRLHDMLVAGGHMSPLEHQARPLDAWARSGNFVGWRQYRKDIPNEHNYSLVGEDA